MSFKRIVFLFFLCLSFYTVQSQNLVPNPSFENIHSYPCNYINTQSEFDDAIEDWKMPTFASTDIYSTVVPKSCSMNCDSEDGDRIGAQMPRTGQTMCGFYAMFAYSIYNNQNYSEYLQVKLTKPLLPGHTYYAEMYVSKADNMKIACNNIGMFFSADLLNSHQYYSEVLPFTPQIKSDSIIGDAINWTKISGTFTANARADYLFIGNFYDNEHTLYSYNNPSAYHDDAYYYIDDVLVKEACDVIRIDTSASICKGNSIDLNFTEAVVGWALADAPTHMISNDATLVASPQVTTTYLAYHICGTPSSFQVIVDRTPSMNIGASRTLCNDEKIRYDVTSDHATYLWQDGSTHPIYEVVDTGVYSVTVKNTCGIFTKSVKINPCCVSAIIPNLITPNGDGLNDTFEIGCYGNGDYSVNIYNQWGSLIYQNKSYLNNWTANEVSGAIYYFEIQKESNTLYKGWVQVIK